MFIYIIIPILKHLSPNFKTLIAHLLRRFQQQTLAPILSATASHQWPTIGHLAHYHHHSPRTRLVLHTLQNETNTKTEQTTRSNGQKLKKCCIEMAIKAKSECRRREGVLIFGNQKAKKKKREKSQAAASESPHHRRSTTATVVVPLPPPPEKSQATKSKEKSKKGKKNKYSKGSRPLTTAT
ncbi:hypothetical protein ES332_D01G245800v1 [Gossypium tomentosum]|uniref:Uncharacterized protein n=1 Tax=Gossypium tomentosum TaxID=34277 RepID=A0A5D2MCZ8_GOSTO|nr:hypothetical protein ES332_D01G245800v1 [Gossypium tomentosum]